jgi:hypothetical protein
MLESAMRNKLTNEDIEEIDGLKLGVDVIDTEESQFASGSLHKD